MNWFSYQSGMAYVMNAQSAFAGSETRGQVDLISRYGYESTPAVVARGTLAMFHWDAKPVLPHVNVPVLIIVGQQELRSNGSDMNPYSSHIGNRNPNEVIAETPAQLQMSVESAGVDSLDRSPAPGKWSPREILCHLADTEIAFAFRLRQVIAEDRHVIQPFDQNKWATQYAGYSTGAALAVFTALRRWNVEFLATVPPEMMDKPLSHPERGDMMFRAIIETMAGHDLIHLAQFHSLSR